MVGKVPFDVSFILFYYSHVEIACIRNSCLVEPEVGIQLFFLLCLSKCKRVCWPFLVCRVLGKFYLEFCSMSAIRKCS